MDAIAALERSHGRLLATVGNISPQALSSSSACDEWDLRSLLNHVLGAGWMFTLANRGEAVPEDGGDRVGDDHLAACTAMAEANVASWRAAGALEGERAFPFGTFPAPVALLINVGEVAVHAWDLGQATGQDATIDAEVADLLLEFYGSIPLDDFRAHGAFGPQIEIDPTAPSGDRVLALLGFQP
jgi:uncharacterized protein (TIGR03086 family)